MTPILAAAGIVTAVCIIAAAIMTGDKTKKAETNILTDFYNAVYVTSDMEAMKSCLFEEYGYYFESAVTMAGMEPDYYKTYREEALEEIGGEFQVKVSIRQREPVEINKLSQLNNIYANISDAEKVTYDIIFQTDNGSKTYSNSLYMVKVKGKWYMSTHLNLPIGTNVYAY